MNRTACKYPLAILFTLLIFSSSFVVAHSADDEQGHYMMMDGMMYNMYGYGLFGRITGGLVIVVLILLIYWLIRQIDQKRR